MLLAQIIDGQITRVAERAEYAELANPPLQAHLDALGLVPVRSTFDQVDRDHKLVPCDPYILDGILYNVAVEPKTEAEISQDKESALASIKMQRNSILSRTDWAELPGALARVGQARINAQLTYRQAVWDRIALLQANNEDPRTFTDWPVAP